MALPLRVDPIRNWRRLRRFVVNQTRLWADVDGVSSARNYLIASRAREYTGGVSTPVSFKSTNGHPIRCRPGTTDAAVVRETFGGLYQLPPAKVKGIKQILDLGSNIGATIVQYAHVFPESRILGVELDRENYDLCLQNVTHLGNRCRVLWGGVWTSDGEIRYQGSEQWGYNIGSGTEGTPSPAFSMSSLLDLIGQPVDFVKMDIEGTEQVLLKQAGEWAHRVKCMKVEIHPPYTVADCIEDLTKAGFSATEDSDQDYEVIAFSRFFYKPAGS